MKTTTINGMTITYPDELIPIFNRSVVKVQGHDGQVIFEISKGDVVYSDARTPFGGAVEIDIAPYLHPFFANALTGSLNLEHEFTLKLYTLSEQGEKQELHTSQHLACYAAVAYGDKWGESPRQRYYAKLLPTQTGSYIATTDTKVNGYAVSQGYGYVTLSRYVTSNAAEITIDYPNGEKIVHSFIRDERECGELFTWIDHQGFIRVFVFDKGETTKTSSDEGVTIYSPWTVQGIVTTEVLYGRPQGSKSSKSVKMCATFADSEDRRLLETMLTATMIYWVKDGVSMPVVLKRGSLSNGDEIQDLEFEFDVPYLPNMLT
jgi:hypothetical protein